ncbi:MAG: sterol desaturase family protein, partial [Burkholderiaceae bacterium]|nr:sterol desaturase family protein [Burkholderiaceae bacterium]
MIQSAIALFDDAHQWLFEIIVQPLFFNLGLSGYLEDAYNGTMWLLIGLLQIAMIATVFGALQRWRPVEPVTNRQEIRNDILYTLIHRLGLFRLVLFFSVAPLVDALFGQARVAGFATFHVDQVWPGGTDIALVSFLIYLLIFDAVDYFYHRTQHRYAWFWSLHAVHHSQRQMT